MHLTPPQTLTTPTHGASAGAGLLDHAVVHRFAAVYDDHLARRAAESAQTVEAIAPPAPVSEQNAAVQAPHGAQAQAEPVAQAVGQEGGREPLTGRAQGSAYGEARAGTGVADSTGERSGTSAGSQGGQKGETQGQETGEKKQAQATPVAGAPSGRAPEAQAQAPSAPAGRVDRPSGVRAEGGRVMPGIGTRAEAVRGRTPGVQNAARPQTLRLEQPEFAAQITRGLAAALRAGSGTVMLQLHPGALGAVRIRMQVEDGQVAARVEASSREARELLTETVGVLRAGLEARGLEVARLEIVGPEEEASPEADVRDRAERHANGHQASEPTGAEDRDGGEDDQAEPGRAPSWGVTIERDGTGVVRLDALA
ncbi:MAG: flagellar hook-length control protein FliK [Phycisphaeraceae bacterium]|nr:flagellar hook-length control protein FliK [Phycisphaeraceae bacterium]